MKEKAHNDSSNQILNSIKTYLFLATFFLGALSLVSAQNSNANENATVYGGEITFSDGETYTSVCVGDGEADHVEVVLENASGRLKQWIITDEEGYILGLPDSPLDVNFEEAEVGVCLIYHLSYNGMKPLVDPSGQGKFKLHIDEVTEKGNGKGRSHLSEPIMVERFQQPIGGTLVGGPFEFCVGDGEADNIPDGAITLSGNMGTNSAWVVTDIDGNILGLPGNYTDVNFDEAPAGTCLVWHLSYEDNVSFEGVTNADELTGCYALTNPVTVNRYQQPIGGTLEGGPFEFCVGDGEVDNIAEGAITLSGNSGTNSTWVVTDDQGEILGTPPSPYAVNFDEAEAGTCLIWYLSYEDNVDLTVENANDLTGCYALTNPISVNRTEINGGTISGGTDDSFSFTVGDDTADKIAADSITLADNVGTNSQWVVTNEDGTIILGLPENYADVDFDEAPAGTCKIWHLSYEDGLEGLTSPDEGDHLMSSLTGACFDLSNAISVVRTAASSGRIGLFPNPTKGTVNIDLSNFGSEDVNLSVYSLQNLRLSSRSLSSKKLNSSKFAILDVSKYEEGIYFISVTDVKTGNTAVKRLVVGQ